MRNIFDQYSQPENRVTHALLTTLKEDRRLLAGFLKDVVGVQSPVPAKDLAILGQQCPGEMEPSEEEAERRGIPDGWIFDEEQAWCVLIESKVMASLGNDQLRRHRRSAERLGFQHITSVAITPEKQAGQYADVTVITWQDIYLWLRKQMATSQWARTVAEYFEIAEARLVGKGQLREGTLTRFSGFPFGVDNAFSYLEAKRVLGLALGELRARRDLQQALRMNPAAPGRGGIRGRSEGRVWDFLSLSGADGDAAFTENIHLTMGIHTDEVVAMVTVPHRVKSAARKKVLALGEDGFQRLTARIVENLQPLLTEHPGASPRMKGVQRRYPSQSAKPFVDANIEFDLRTAVANGGPPKTQQRWLEAAYQCFAHKEGSNYQIQMGVVFPYDRCPALKEPTAIGLIANAWLGCKPLVDLAR